MDDAAREGRPVLLEVEGLTKRHRGADRPAVREVTLSVPRGEILGLVGQSGSGKTTLLRLVAGLEAPTRGAIRIGGRRVAGPGAWVPPEDRPLGMLFQDGALFPHLRVTGNVDFGLRGRPAPDRRGRRREVLRLVGLEGLAGRYPHQLSGGERRRAALARALAPEPELMLLDEPFTGLDENLTTRLRDSVSRILRRTGTTALVVLHSSDEVLPVSDRIGVMREGRLVQCGTPEEVYVRPRSAYVARLFGPANVVPARARGGVLETALGEVPVDGGPVRGDRWVCCRPEDVELAAPESSPGRGRVVETGFRGDRLDVTVRLDGPGQEETIVHVRGDPSDPPRPGEPVGLRLRPDRAHVLEDFDAPDDGGIAG